MLPRRPRASLLVRIPFAGCPSDDKVVLKLNTSSSSSMGTTAVVVEVVVRSASSSSDCSPLSGLLSFSVLALSPLTAKYNNNKNVIMVIIYCSEIDARVAHKVHLSKKP